MLREFQQMLVLNKTGLDPFRATFEFTPQKPDSPTTKNGNPIIYVEEPSDNSRHIALGRYLDAWSRVETGISALVRRSTGSQIGQAHILMNALGMHGALDVLNVMPINGISKAQHSKLCALLDRVKNQNTNRNRIVHGKWLLELRLFDWGGKIGVRRFQYRYYPPSDPQVIEAIRSETDKRARKKYLFSIPRVEGITAEVLRLSEELQEFMAEIDNRPKGTRLLQFAAGPLGE